MKNKCRALCLAGLLVSTVNFAETPEIKGPVPETRGPVHSAPNSSVNSSNNKAIKGTNAGGEAQTTVIDENGNLKMLDSGAAPKSQPSAGQPNTRMHTPPDPTINGTGLSH